MWKKRLLAFLLLAVSVGIGYFVYQSQLNPDSKFPFKLGLDLNGGTHLVYKADVSSLKDTDVNSAMSALRDVIERRVNMFGVSEPLVQVEKGGVPGGGTEYRLIVELPGVTDVKSAIAMIGQLPVLEFKLLNDTTGMTEEQINNTPLDQLFTNTELSGRYLDKAQLIFDPSTGEPKVSLNFNAEGMKIMAKITKENKDKVLAISLDGVPISTPVIREEIRDGKAEISGNFKAEEARTLARDLNYGALPIPISREPINTQTIGASLGEEAKNAGVAAGVYAFIIIGIFLILWYRIPGFVAVISLAIYVFINLALFKLIPVTLTAAGIAGFILSLGMAVDANILIFERMKEELARGKNLADAMKEGFARAWLSIRDSNISSIITSIILFWFASSSVIKGFALVFGIGVITSMFTAVTMSRSFLMAVKLSDGKLTRFLFSCGLHGGQQKVISIKK